MIKLSIEEKMFPDRVIISDFNISIQKNEFVVITGASGAGKSTLLNIIGLIDTSYHGRYILDGVDVSGIDYKRQLYLRGSYFGYIFQDSLINEKQTILRNLLSVIELKKQDCMAYLRKHQRLYYLVAKNNVLHLQEPY